MEPVQPDFLESGFWGSDLASRSFISLSACFRIEIQVKLARPVATQVKSISAVPRLSAVPICANLPPYIPQFSGIYRQDVTRVRSLWWLASGNVFGL